MEILHKEYKKIMEDYKKSIDYLYPISENSFIEGLLLLQSKVLPGKDGAYNFYCNDDEFVAYHIKNLDLSKEDVRKLAELAWGINDDGNFYKFL